MCCQRIYLRKKTTPTRTNWTAKLCLVPAAFELLGLISEGPGYCLELLPSVAIFLPVIYFDILIMLSFENEAISAVLCGQWFLRPENHLNETLLYLKKLMLLLGKCISNELLYM